ncbi:MAG: ShlB/FhaC/HecB family hemolysin secretion/activation protein [Noviherbaspirillum sp.]
MLRLVRFAFTLVVSILALQLVLPAMTYALPVPDAGQILRELRQPASPGMLPHPAVRTEGPLSERPEDEVRFAVTSFDISGNTAIATGELQELLADQLGRRLGLGELRNAATRITALYRERGYAVARAYLPAQDIKGGRVPIMVLEGNLAKVQLRNASSLSDERALAYFKEAAAGAAICSNQVDRGLLLLNDVPGVGAVRATLQADAAVGSSDMLVEIDPGPRFAGNLALDNYGNRYTGNARMSGTLCINILSGIGDQIAATGLLSNHKLGYGRLAYSMPLGRDGMRAGIAYAATRYELAREFAALDAHGRATSLGLSLSYPFIRSQRGLLNGALGIEARRLSDRIGATTTVNEKRARVANLGLTASYQDALLGGGVSGLELVGSFGRLEIESPAALAIDQASARTDGAYGKLYLAANRLQRLSDQDQLWIALPGRWTNKNLDSSEKFLLGGANGVRASPQGEGMGDQGYLATLELRHNFSESLQGTMFYDAGSVRISHTTYDATASNRRSLAGAGLGFNAVLAGIDLRASLA